MRRLFLCLLIVLGVTLAVPVYAGQGNQAPPGPHFNLNIIGVPKEKSADMEDSNRHVIFVKLSGKTRILLSEGDFRVLDGNGTDGTAKFQLPNPDPDNDGVTEYSVWVRAVGTPGGSTTMTTCYTYYDEELGEDVEVCSTYQLVIVREQKNNKFSDVTRELLYIYVDLDGDSIPERYPLFSDALYGYFWDYDNSGLKVAQFRFYEIPTDVN
jgi:hypothetical protein